MAPTHRRLFLGYALQFGVLVGTLQLAFVGEVGDAPAPPHEVMRDLIGAIVTVRYQGCLLWSFGVSGWPEAVAVGLRRSA